MQLQTKTCYDLKTSQHSKHMPYKGAVYRRSADMSSCTNFWKVLKVNTTRAQHQHCKDYISTFSITGGGRPQLSGMSDASVESLTSRKLAGQIQPYSYGSVYFILFEFMLNRIVSSENCFIRMCMIIIYPKYISTISVTKPAQKLILYKYVLGDFNTSC